MNDVWRDTDSIVIVSGLPRSGTSLMMAMLKAGGVPLLVDSVRKADEDNPNGYFEYEPVKSLESGANAWLELATGKAVKVISALLEYLPPDRLYYVLFMNRRLDEVVASQDTMLARRGQAPVPVDSDRMEIMLQKHLVRVVDWLRAQPNIRWMQVDYNELLNDPLPQVNAVNRFLGGSLDQTLMAAVIRPDLYRNRA
jgi:hypothetical protein